MVVSLSLAGAVPTQASAAVDIVSRGFSPDPGVIGSTATLDVSVKVGAAPYIVEFFCCDVLNTVTAQTVIDDSSPTTQALTGDHKFTFDPSTGGVNGDKRAVTVRVTDSNGDQSRQVFVFQPPRAAVAPTPVPPKSPTTPSTPTTPATPTTPRPPTTPATPTAPDAPVVQKQCDPAVSFGLVKAQVTGPGCWQKVQAPSSGYAEEGVNVRGGGTFYRFNGSFKLNGIPFPAAPSGRTYMLAEPSPDAPGGQLGLDGVVELKLKQVTVFRQKLLWKLPSGTTEGKLAGFTLPGGGSLGGLPIGGTVEVIFRKRSNRFATSFPITVTLPSIFKPSPGTQGSITGSTEITTDETSGINLDGGKVQVANAAIGKLAIKNLCFSYLSANVSTSFAACQPPSLNGAPAVQCAPPRKAEERFDGSLLVQLPTGKETQFAAFGGISGGQFAYGGGFVDNAGIPLVAGIALERFGFGLCLKPTLLLKADAGLSFAKGLVRGDVSLTYAEPTAKSFFVEAAGFLRVADIPVGNGRVKIDSTGTVDFDVQAAINIADGFLKADGKVAGFIQPNPFAFNVDGDLQVCIDIKIANPCARGGITVSNKGVGGCADLPFFRVWSAHFFWVKPKDRKQFDFGTTCGFRDPVRVTRSRQAGAPLTFPVAPNSQQYLAHFDGVGKPPKVRITSPSGKVFASGPDRSTTDGESFLIMENPTAPETVVFLKENAAAGDWKVEPLEGSTVTGVSFQDEEKEPTVVSATTLPLKTGGRVADIAFDARAGDRVQLDIVGQEYQQRIATNVVGRPCPAGRKAPGRTNAQSLCARVSWKPKFGFGGPRTLQATVFTKDDIVLGESAVARFIAPPPKLSPTVPALRLVRRGTDVFAIWGRSGGNTVRYAAYAQLTNGRKIGHTSPETCLAWRIRNVSPRTGVTLRLQSGRPDLRFSPAKSVKLLPGKLYAGPPQLKKAKVPTPCESI
ncbi:hypothetical protein [Paraconexibacter sp. AEG42_29]|uniref:hypothetical protein n=1 Tax=Paraconexibacter sp. AEG42_29 TaxID=2997339 RepID=UPI00339D909B